MIKFVKKDLLISLKDLKINMNNSYDKTINEHYSKVLKFKKSKLSTMNDLYVRNEETKFILNQIKNSKKKLNILDMGCGNGYTLSQIAKIKKHHLFGMENNFSLYNISYNRLKNDAQILHGDIRILKEKFIKKFDLIILQRVLINVLNNSHQKKILIKCSKIFKKKWKINSY